MRSLREGVRWVRHSENKRFLDTLFGKATMAGGAAIALGIVVLGGRVLQDEDRIRA